MSWDVTVRFYGNLGRLAGGRTRTVRLEGDAPSVSDLRAALATQVPDIAPHLHHTAVGVGTELLGDDAPVPRGGEVALLPPVSGG